MKYEHGQSLSDLKKRPKSFPGFTAFQSYVLESLKLTEEDAEAFVAADVSRLHSPFLLPDIREAVKKIRNFILQKKSILLYGDRDTDGVSSTSLLGIYFREQIRKNGGTLSIRTSTANDDYGLCGTVMTQIQNLKPDLLITLDFGTSNEAEINKLAAQGIEVIVLDHHEIPVRIPRCLLINPKRADSIYPEKRICTSALAAKLIMALLIAEKAEEKPGSPLTFFSFLLKRKRIMTN
ncbi:MAG TPA: DHH family phosphoesterase [Leptospiraceae bacterium]|nr:DHH family phosphoesterase [Leptospiraceae bacterium]